MKISPVLFIAGTFLVGLLLGEGVCAQEFQVRELTDNVYAVGRESDGLEQVVIASEKGLVVLNSFWSEVPAREFREQITRLLGRDDFIYQINMADRLDLFGGNAAYEDISIVGHKAFIDKYKGREDAVSREIDELVDMWKWKEGVARERLPSHEPGSDQAINEQRWINTCKARAEELETGFSLVLPTETYEDVKAIDLGNLTLNVIWFGKAGYEGMAVIVIPEARLALIPGFIMHSQHLAPYPMWDFTVLDVPRWIRVLEDMLEGDNAVESVLCGVNSTDIWPVDRARTHLHYIRKLWNDVTRLEAAGEDLPEIHADLSLDGEFAFVKEMPIYEHGDDWVRPQHHDHIRLFFLQHKNPATEMIKDLSGEMLSDALAKIRTLSDQGGDLYVEELALNRIGYQLLAQERIADATAVLKLNVDMFPESANAYDSYAEALAKGGDIENAVINYEKSLELNPENSNARDMLETLRKQL